MLASVLIPKLLSRFPGRGLRIALPPAACAVFPAIHPEVGDVEIYDDGNELTVVVGKFTHGHFSNYDDNLTGDQKAEEIAEAVATFLESLFADRVVLWGSHKGSGGWYFVEDEESSFRTDQKEYLWSGPASKNAEP